MKRAFRVTVVRVETTYRVRVGCVTVGRGSKKECEKLADELKADRKKAKAIRKAFLDQLAKAFGEPWQRSLAEFTVTIKTRKDAYSNQEIPIDLSKEMDRAYVRAAHKRAVRRALRSTDISEKESPGGFF